MANTLTNLIPDILQSLDVVSREQVGFIPAVSRNSDASRAALNQTVTTPVVPAAAAADNTPGVTAPDTGDQVIGNMQMTISKSKHVPIRWNGEETRGMTNAGTYMQTLRNQFEQAFRTLTNLIEVDLFTAARVSASRAYGTAGTTPFATAGDLSDLAQTRKIYNDNGGPGSDIHLVLGTSAIANIQGKQSTLFKVNEAGSAGLLRAGTIGMLEGVDVGASNQIASVTKGTGASYTTNTAGYAVGATSITLITGSGTVLAGDVVTFAGDTNKYVVATGTAAAGAIVLAAPGLLQAIPASATAMTVGNTSTANMLFHRSAIQLMTRAPAVPEGGDSSLDNVFVTDPISGLVFEIANYKGFLQNVYHVRIAWGTKGIKSNHTVQLLG